MTRITLNNVESKRVVYSKYLGCYFHERPCKIDFSYEIRKFYGNFNNIMSVIGYNRNEMAALHLVKTYCVPTVNLLCMVVKRGIWIIMITTD